MIMSYTVEQFNPCKPTINVDGYELELQLLTLHNTVKLKKLIGDLPEIYLHLKEHPKDIINVIWYLINPKDKHLFENRFHVFQKKYLEEDITKISEKSYLAFDEVVAASMPVVINRERDEAIAKMNNGGEVKPPCYARYYDALSKRYSLTLDKFYELTLRNISSMLKIIADESYSELEVQAALAGRKLKPKITYNEFTPEQEKENDDAALDALASLQKDYLDKQKEKENNNG
jgi:hypothetical protein